MDDRETQITEAEYRWRKEHDLSCRQTETGYSRPMNADLDLKCFYAVLGMLNASGREVNIFFLAGKTAGSEIWEKALSADGAFFSGEDVPCCRGGGTKKG